jgi:hypothetical protein
MDGARSPRHSLGMGSHMIRDRDVASTMPSARAFVGDGARSCETARANRSRGIELPGFRSASAVANGLATACRLV